MSVGEEERTRGGLTWARWLTFREEVGVLVLRPQESWADQWVRPPPEKFIGHDGRVRAAMMLAWLMT